MSRRARIFRNIAIGLSALIVVVVVSAIMVVRTAAFREFVKTRIITATEEGTGGNVEIGSFSFEWSHLRAIVTNFVIHGHEPAGAAPYLRARRVELDIRLFTGLKHILDIAYLGVEQPEANVIVFPDGSTNVPSPKEKSTSSSKTAFETVVDLAVGHFDLTNGSLTFNQQKQALDVRGNNLRVQLGWDVLHQAYKGGISLEPLYVASGRNTPVRFTVTLPVTLQRDRIDFQNARISTATSEILINGLLENLRHPKMSAHISGHLALADLKNAGDLPLNLNARNVPSRVDLDASATMADNTIQVSGLRVGIGHSNIEASGKLKDPAKNGSLQFNVELALGELGRLAGVSARAEGTIELHGTAQLDRNNNYDVMGNLQAKDASVQPPGSQRIGNVNVISAVHLDPHRLELEGLRVAAFGAQLEVNASLEDFARYQISGNLRRLDLKTAAAEAGQKNFAYDGVVSGAIAAEGDIKAPGAKSVMARAHLTIVPGRRSIPVSGRLNADYNGATDNLTIADSFIVLPHSRITLTGSLGDRLNVVLTTRDLNDLLAAAPSSGPPLITLNGGQASLTTVVTGKLTSPRIAGHLAMDRFQMGGRQFDALVMDLAGSSSGAAVSNGSLNRGMMQARFDARVGLRNWKAVPNQLLAVDATVRNGDLADVMVLAGQPAGGYSGGLSVDAHVAGTVGNPRGTANLQLANGTIQNEPFDIVHAEMKLADQLVEIPTAYIAAGSARVNLTAEFQHPRDSFTTGRLHAHLQSNELNFAQLRSLQKQRPNTAGVFQIDADLVGSLSEIKSGGKEEAEFLLASVNADASARGLRFQGQNYGDFNATARTKGQTVNYNVTSDFAGSNIHVNGNTQLIKGYPTKADVNLRNLAIERVLAVANRTDIPAKGMLSGTAHFAGTTENPQGNVDLDVANAVLYNEPVDHVRARVTYLAQSIDVPQLEIAAGPSRIDLTARYDHPSGNLQAGNLQFRLNNTRIDLVRIRNLQTMRPGLGGTLQLAANGAATVREAAPRVQIRELNANIAATGLAAQGKNFGDLTLTADTTGDRTNFALDSNLANASIHGRGNAQLRDDFPVTAEVSFNNVRWTRVQELLGPGNGEPSDFDAAADGQVNVTGPIINTDGLRGSFQLSKLQISTVPMRRASERPIVIENQGPISVTLDHSVARIESLHLTGPQTDVQVGGTASLTGKTLSATLNANTNLALLQQFNRDVVSSGGLVLATTVRGTMDKPLVSGRLELHNASLNYTEIPNGISNANGVVLFNGSNASVQNLTAEVGGGKLTVGGFVAYTEMVRFALHANASNVRVRLQQGVSATANLNVNLTGGMQASMASGTVTINQVTYEPQSDFGSILSRAAPPVQAPTAPSPMLQNMKLDIQVRTSASMAVQASVAHNLQADANLRIRGTAAEPGVLGRISLKEGNLTFFGSTYTVNSGTISFYNPVRIEPVLNISLETQAKGVDVVLTVTGTIDNMKLSYTSDPPLQFQEIVSLLATGKTPTSDPTILANQPAQPPQTFEQMGESAIVSKALADPVANQLQRVFGVSQLKIDPTFTSGAELPQARLTLQQQVSTNITFTYVTALNDPNTQIISAEWAVNPQWSGVATRDENGIFSVKFLYKKQFR
jgi:translocation and assembly module TamB